MVNDKLIFISLFAGCGGSSLGYKWAGFKELLAIDFDRNAIETFKFNFPDIPCWQRDIREVTGKEIMNFCGIKKGELDLLDASPPCQGFSTAGKRNVNDERNDLFKEFIKLIEELNPKVFVMENVSGLIKGKMKGRFIEIMKELKSLPYQVKCKLINAKYYSVPQSRQRLIWIGVRKNLGKEVSFPTPMNKILKIKDVINDLLEKDMNESIGHIWFDDEGKKTKSYFKALKARQGQRYAGRQRRYCWNKPVGTLQTPGGRITIPGTLRNIGCHPLKTRTFSIREYARLQTFPDDFKVMNHLCYGFKQIGNSVPPKLMEAIAKNIKKQIFDISK